MIYQIKKFFRQLFCKHDYDKIVYSTECYVEVKCSKCKKKKIVENHDWSNVINAASWFERGIFGYTRIYVLQACRKCGELRKVER